MPRAAPCHGVLPSASSAPPSPVISSYTAGRRAGRTLPAERCSKQTPSQPAARRPRIRLEHNGGDLDGSIRHFARSRPAIRATAAAGAGHQDGIRAVGWAERSLAADTLLAEPAGQIIGLDALKEAICARLAPRNGRP